MSHSLWRLFPISGLIFCAICGCGTGESGGSEHDSGVEPGSHSAAAVPGQTSIGGQHDSTVSGTPPQSTKRRPDEVWTDADGRQFIGNVPYDVFFDHPLTVASEGQRVFDSEDAATRPPSQIGSNTSGLIDNDASTAGSNAESLAVTDWTSILPAGVLQSEVTSIRNFLNQKLQSVGGYNTAVTMIPSRAATIAVLAAIAIEHPGDISWKEDAGYVRDLAASMNETSLQRGPRDQRRLRAVFENLEDTLNRSRPAGLSEPDPDTLLSEVAKMGLVMKRMQEAEQRLRTEISEASFDSQKDVVVHEAAILSGLTYAMTSESYGFSDDPEFTGYAQKVSRSGQGIRSAADKGDFSEFELNLSRLSTACQACHREYKSN